MTFEIAKAQPVERPWGIVQGASAIGPWSAGGAPGAPIGEIWYERASVAPAPPALLLKLLFTSQPLSIQVHPDDAYARSKGLANGKTEAWYVLDASGGARVGVGLKTMLTRSQLQHAAADGSITELVAWKDVAVGDAILVRAGTIHGIGAGLVIAEIQQRSDATYRLFDYGSKRDLHLDDAFTVSQLVPTAASEGARRIDRERTLLVRSPYFVMERLELEPGTIRRLATELETWVLVIGGGGRAGPHAVARGDALFVQSDHVDIHAGSDGLVALAAYTGDRLISHLLQPSDQCAPATSATQKPFVETVVAGPSPNVR